MKNLVIAFFGTLLMTNVMLGQDADSSKTSLSESEISCHEISVSILGVITVSNIYVCCGGHYVNNLIFPPRLCAIVSKRTYDLFTSKQGQPEDFHSVVTILDLVPDKEEAQKMQEIIIEKSSSFEHSGMKYSIKTGKYAVGSNGEIALEILTE